MHLMSQLISGSMVVKMLSWETPFTKKIKLLRDQEESFLSKMAFVRGCNISLESYIGLMAAFVTFSIVWAQGHSLKMTEVFYVLVLLGLPQFTMAAPFVQGT